jgi:uncharacterized membrane protein
MTADDQDELRRRAEFLSALSTEHFTLQGARSGTISEAASRSSLYMTTLSSAVVALALVAQLSKDTTLLPVFALAVLPVVFFLGLVTYGRLLECGMQDVFYARSISRIRRLYRELDPSRAHYFHEVGVDQGGTPPPELVTLRVQQFLPASAMVAIVNSVVGGVFIAAAAAYLFTPPTWVAAALGIVSTVIISTAFLTHQRHVWGRVDRIDPLTAPNADPVKAE